MRASPRREPRTCGSAPPRARRYPAARWACSCSRCPRCGSASSPRPAAGGAGSEYELRQPTRLSMGAALRTSPRLTLYAQADRVRLHEVQALLAITQGAYSRADYILGDAWEGGAGAEISVPLR